MSDSDYSILELRELSESDAKAAFMDDEMSAEDFERWEQLNELEQGAQDTRDRFADEDEQVADLTVRADMDALGTEVELYGNDVLVHVNTEAEAFVDAAERVDELMSDTDPEDVGELGADALDEIATNLKTMFDEAFVRWNGHEWADLREDQRADVLASIRQRWGVDAMLNAWLDIAVAIHEEREDQMDVIESFRTPERRGRR